MPSRYRCVIACALVALSLMAVGRSVRAEGGPGDLWQTFTTNDGLGSGSVAAVFQAQDGALWFGTDAGASRYNGAWESFGEHDGLPAGRVRVIVQTDDGALWFGAQLGGVVRCAATGRHCGRPWTTAQGLPDNDVHTLHPVGNGSNALWVGTAKGLAYLDGEHVTAEKQLEGIGIWALEAHPDGALLVGTADNGVWRRDASGAWRTLPKITGTVYALSVGRAGQVWAGTEEGLFVLQNNGWRQLTLIENEESTQVFAITHDSSGRPWVGTDAGLIYARNARTPELLDGWLGAQPGGLVNNYVRALTFASDGGLWLGTLAGISRYDENSWQTIRDENVAGQRINAILLDSDARTWVGTEYNGLVMYEKGSWRRFGSGNGLPDDRVVSLFLDTAGRVWIGTGTGIGYRTAAGKFTFFAASSGIAGFPVYSMAQDASGALVVATQGGASRFDDKGQFQPLPGLEAKRINAVHRTTDGTLWFGTEQDGLLQWVNDRLTQVRSPDGRSFRSIVVNGITSSRDGALWMATYDDGLWRQMDGQWQRMDASLPTPRILALKYLDNNLWVGTRQGFGRFDGKTWQSYAGDGLPSLEILAIGPGPEDSVWIGSTGGIVRYTPEKDPPWVQIESVNLTRPVNGYVRLVSDRLAGLQLIGGDLATRPERIRFLTQLEGIDTTPQFHLSGQVALGERRLRPGIYRLRAWARDNSLNYSPPVEATIEVPTLVWLPGGRAVTSNVLIAVLVMGLAAIGGLAVATSIGLRVRREAQARTAADTARHREALERHFNPYISGEPVRKVDMFFGRDALLRKILNALHQNSIMIHGERRMGKTTLLYQLGQALREADDPEWVFVPVSVDLEGTAQERLFYLLMDAAWGILQDYLTQTPLTLHFHSVAPDRYTDREFSADLRKIIDALKPIVAPREMRIILLVDEMDAIDSYDRQIQLQLRRIFMSPLAANLGAVVAGVQINKAWDRVESPWYNLFNEFPLEPFDDAQARQLLTEPVRGVYEWDPEAVTFVVARAEGRPYRLQQLALEAVNQMLAAGRMQITPADVQAADVIVEGTRTA